MRSSNRVLNLQADAAERRMVRVERVTPLIVEVEAWMRAERVRLSRHAELVKAMRSGRNAFAMFRQSRVPFESSSADIELLPLVSVVMQSMASIWGGDAGPI